MIDRYRPAFMQFFPGVPWNQWEDVPYDLVLSCIDYIKKVTDGR